MRVSEDHPSSRIFYALKYFPNTLEQYEWFEKAYLKKAVERKNKENKIKIMFFFFK